MGKVRAKKHLGQHFLTDLNIAQRIVDSLTDDSPSTILEIGPGMGVLTQFLLQNKRFDVNVIEIDRDSVAYLKEHYPVLDCKIIEADFLKISLEDYFKKEFSIIGNFPYNISSQILFKLINYRDQVPQLVGMFQKEVAERIASSSGTKKFGILSVFLQVYYDIEYLFTVNETVFNPPPRVKSGVIRLIRNKVDKLDCEEKLFFRVVKAAFNQRRKTLANSLKVVLDGAKPDSDPMFKLRPEQLEVTDFIELTNKVESLIDKKD